MCERDKIKHWRPTWLKRKISNSADYFFTSLKKRKNQKPPKYCVFFSLLPEEMKSKKYEKFISILRDEASEKPTGWQTYHQIIGKFCLQNKMEFIFILYYILFFKKLKPIFFISFLLVAVTRWRIFFHKILFSLTIKVA